MTTESTPNLREQALDELEASGHMVYEQVATMWAQGWPGGRVPFSSPKSVDSKVSGW